MTLLFNFLIAAALIAAFVVLRLLTDRSVMRARLGQDRADCEQTGCGGGCGSSPTGADPVSVSDKNTPTRSACHAP